MAIANIKKMLYLCSVFRANCCSRIVHGCKKSLTFNYFTI